MASTEEVQKFLEQNYLNRNSKKGRNISVPEKLKRDYHALQISRGKTISEGVRFYMAKELLENGKHN